MTMKLFFFLSKCVYLKWYGGKKSSSFFLGYTGSMISSSKEEPIFIFFWFYVLSWKIAFHTSQDANKHHEMTNLTSNSTGSYLSLVKIHRQLTVDKIILIILWYFLATFDEGTSIFLLMLVEGPIMQSICWQICTHRW